MMSYRIFFPLLFTLLSSACQDGADAGEVTGTEKPAEVVAPPTPEPEPENLIRYSWVDDLNLRAKPTVSGKVLAKIPTTEPLTLTGQKTSGEQAFVLRGTLYTEPWYEVTTENGTTGWVFGGAIKEQHERKGNPPVDGLRFNYPYLGQYDLTNWEKEGEETVEEGDVESKITAYRGDGQRMIITRSTSEYGYQLDHEVTNLQGQKLRARSLSFDNQTGEITEEVRNYMGAEPTLYRRALKTTVSYQQLNALPVRIPGDFSESTLPESELN